MSSARRGGFPGRRRRLPLQLGVCLAAALLVLAFVPSVASAAVTNASTNSQKVLQFMNAERAARGLAPLSRDSRLDSLAQSWANKMAAARTMYHPGTPQAMSSAGYRSGAQNLAWHDDVLTAAWAHNFWMGSSPHRKNILDPAFTHTGVAFACNPSGGRWPYVFVTVEFGGSSAPLSSVPSASPRVAGSQSEPGAGCEGSQAAAPPPPAPAPPPPPPAPVAPPPVAAKSTPKAPATTPAAGTKKASPSPSASARPSNKASPSAKPSASPSPKASSSPFPPALPAGASPEPSRSASPAAGPPPALDALASSRGRADTSSAPLVALIAGLSGILLMTRVRVRRRRGAPPKHAISRR